MHAIVAGYARRLKMPRLHAYAERAVRWALSQ